MTRAIASCQRREAVAAVCAKLDRITRSVGDFSRLLEEAQKGGWNIVVPDPEIDLFSPWGDALGNILMVFAQLERRMISARTKSALAEARSRGVTLGRPSKTTQELRNIVRDAYNRMGSQQRTADELNRVGLATPTGQGRRWYRTTVARALQTVI